MFERFTEDARHVVVLAQEEARGLLHNYIGTEHLLLGLLRQDAGLAATVLASLDVTVERVRSQIARMVGSGEEVTSGQIPFTPRAKKVLEMSLREALALGHNYIGTEHILLGLLRDSEGVGARVLLEFGYDAERIRNDVIRQLSGGPSLRPPLLETPSALLARAAPEIRDRFNRAADRGDLVLVAASAPSGVVARAFAALGINGDALRAALDRARDDGPDDVGDQLDHARLRKDAAIEAGETETAQQALAEERRLQAELDQDPMEAARKLLGL